MWQCRSPRTSSSSTSAGGVPAERPLAQLGRAPRHAERRVDGCLVRCRRERAEGIDVGPAAGRAQELRPEAIGLGDDQLERDAVDGDAERAPRFPLHHGHDRGKALEPLQDRVGLVRCDDDREVERDVRPAARVSGHLAAEHRRHLLGHGAGPVEREALPGRRRIPAQALQYLTLGVRADAGHLLQAPLARRGVELLDRPHAEYAPDLEHPLRGDADEPPEADELRPEVPLELVQLCDRPGLHELAQTPRDARPDPAQLLGSSCARQLRDGRRRLPDRLRRATVGAGGVALGTGQLE